MTESDVSNSVRRYILKEYWTDGQVKYIYEATQYNLKRPDLLVFIEYQSPKRQWVIHSVESKAKRRDLRVSDWRYVCSAVKQARNYKANYRWLAISKEAFMDLTEEEWDKLRVDCCGTTHNTGFLIAYKTKVDEVIKAGYHPGNWIEYYQQQEWLIDTLI